MLEGRADVGVGAERVPRLAGGRETVTDPGEATEEAGDALGKVVGPAGMTIGAVVCKGRPRSVPTVMEGADKDAAGRGSSLPEDDGAEASIVPGAADGIEAGAGRTAGIVGAGLSSPGMCVIRPDPADEELIGELSTFSTT